MKRGLVYIVTGDSYTEVDTKGGDDAVVAIEMKTGKIRWRNQVTEHDNYVMAPARRVSNRPPIVRIPKARTSISGATPVLFTLKNGKQVVIAGQKSGLVYSLNPDNGSCYGLLALVRVRR